MRATRDEDGFILVTTLFMMAVMLSLVGAYFITNRVEIASTLATSNSANGFYTAEAGLNLRAEGIRNVFVGYNVPDGTSPTEPNACEGGNVGTDNFLCQDYEMGNHDARTYVVEEPGNPQTVPIPPGERYENLNSQQYWYTIKSKALNSREETEALLELRFKSVLVPMFQFLAFYDKDLEILPGPAATMNGRIHTNGDLYLNTDNASPGLRIDGQITTAGDLYRGRKNNRSCAANPVSVRDPAVYRRLPDCTGSSLRMVTQSEVDPFNNRIQMNVPEVTVPGPEILDPNSSGLYWSKADLRLVLNLSATNTIVTTNSLTGVEVRRIDDTVDTVATTNLYNCTGAAASGTRAAALANFYNGRENKNILALDVDIRQLLECFKNNAGLGSGKALNDDTEGGLVVHLSVKGPDSNIAANRYAVRARNGATLQATSATPVVRGITMVSDQASYIYGNYNSVGRIPAAVLSDSINILSNGWSDLTCRCSVGTITANNCNAAGHCRWIDRTVGANMTFNAAVLTGTDSTGGIEGVGGQNGAYNGGLENMPRFLENWSGRTFTYSGSWVSLSTPRHVNGLWPNTGSPHYNPPTRTWSYDTSFDNAANLPPLTPRFVYLRQELFVRDYQRDG